MANGVGRCAVIGCSQWFSVLSQVQGSTEQEIREMHDEQANPQNAVVSTDACWETELLFTLMYVMSTLRG